MSWPLLVSAAEASGDLLGAALVRELLARRPAMHVCGLAGPELRAAGALAIGRAEDLGVAGLVEVVPALPRVLSLRRRLQAALNEGRPRVGVLIDAPDLHLRLHRAARSAGVRTVQLVAPQFWAWRPGKYGDLFYAQRQAGGGALAPVNSGPRDLMSFDLPMRLFHDEAMT